MHPGDALKKNLSSPHGAPRNPNELKLDTAGSRIALVGAANSGKTTLFNLLTGADNMTVNYPGATVEYALGRARLVKGVDARIMDTPGLGSLLPGSHDEDVTIRALFDESLQPDLVVAVVDASQLSRHLYMAHQLQRVGFNLVVVCSMGDLLEKRGCRLDPSRLASVMDVPVLCVDPRHKTSLPALKAFLKEHVGAGLRPTRKQYDAYVAELDTDEIQKAYSWTDEAEALSILDLQTQRPLKESATKDDDSRSASPPKTSALAVRDLDRILLHPIWGVLIFAILMIGTFTSIFWAAAPLMDALDALFVAMVDGTNAALPAGWWTALLADGLIGGVGAVAVFLPQIVILFLIMGYLESSGYLARGAALVDKPLSKLGLNGKSFVPLLSGYACAIPALMATRTIPNRFERNLTLFIIPLMSCSARLPVYALLIAFLTPRDKPWLGGLALAAIYATSLFLGALVSGLINRFRRDKEVSSFMLELPSLRRPVARVVLNSTYHKAKQYLFKAGPTIVVLSVLLWIFTHSVPPSARQKVEGAGESSVVSHSYAAKAGHILEPVMEPMGLDWRGGVAILSAFAAREVFVSVLALVYQVDEDEGDGVSDRLLNAISTATFHDSDRKVFTTASSLGLIAFFMIALLCFPTTAVAKREFGSWKLALAQLGSFVLAAYLAAVIVVQGLRALGIN